MSSWFSCSCGNRVHTDWCAGEYVYMLVRDDLWDRFVALAEAGDFKQRAVLSGAITVRCRSCGRIAVFWEEVEEPAVYVRALKKFNLIAVFDKSDLDRVLKTAAAVAYVCR